MLKNLFKRKSEKLESKLSVEEAEIFFRAFRIDIREMGLMHLNRDPIYESNYYSKWFEDLKAIPYKKYDKTYVRVTGTYACQCFATGKPFQNGNMTAEPIYEEINFEKELLNQLIYRLQ